MIGERYPLSNVSWGIKVLIPSVGKTSSVFKVAATKPANITPDVKAFLLASDT